MSRITTYVLGALAGLIIALVCVAAMPHHHVATVSVALPAGSRVQVPAGAQLTRGAQLYGALGPGRSPATLVFTAVAATGARAVMSVRTQERRWLARASGALQIPTQSPTVTTEDSPRLLRDALLGVIAGLFVTLALVSVGRRTRVRAA